MYRFIFTIILLVIATASKAANHCVVLQYHHFSETTPAITSVTPQQFNAHLDYLANNGVSQMNRKGRIQEGADADIVVFDPATVTDNSDLFPLDKNVAPSTGIPYVIVSGVVVVEDSKVLKVFPGKPVRAEIIE